MQIDGARIVITGSASGIGAALLKLLASYDCQIIAVDRDEVVIPAGKARVESFTGDLAQPETVDSLFQHAQGSMGGIDIFIANAGFAYYERITEADWQRIEAIYRVNVMSPLYTLEKMQALNPMQPYMVVLNASAIALLPLAAGYAHYTSTKAALHAFAETYRLEKPRNAHLLVAYPIATRTDFFSEADAPVLKPVQRPEYVAHRILNGIQRDRKAVHPSPGFLGYLMVGRLLPFIFAPFRLYTRWLLRRWERKQQRSSRNRSKPDQV